VHVLKEPDWAFKTLLLLLLHFGKHRFAVDICAAGQISALTEIYINAVKGE
jgi:hypothetical protein